VFVETPSELILWDVLEEHLDEGGFELERWQRALFAPHYSLLEVAEGPEETLLAHLSALLIAGPAAFQRLLAPLLATPPGQDPPLLSVAAAVALARHDYDAIFGALERGTHRERSALVRGLTLASDPRFDAHLAARHDAGSFEGDAAATALELAAARGVRLALAGPLYSSDVPELTAAARAALGSQDRSELSRLEELTLHQDAGVRDAALEVAVTWGSALAFRRCLELAQAHQTVSETVLSLIALLGGPEEHAILHGWSESDCKGAQHAAIRALGMSGDSDNVERLLPLLGSDDVIGAKLAGEAIALISGLDASQSEWQHSSPPVSDESEARQALPDLKDDDLSMDLRPTLAALLPELDLGKVTRWWSLARPRFRARERLLQGLPANRETHLALLRSANMRNRPLVAQSLRLRSLGRQSLEVRAPAASQLSALRALEQQPDLMRANALARW
jgi:uncharacterized protein (TIGR02270 family)